MTDLSKDNDIVFTAKLHWIIFFVPVLSFLVCLMAGWYFRSNPQIDYGGLPSHLIVFFGGFALIWILMTWVTYYFSSLTIQKKRVIIRTGVIVRQTVDVPLAKIETIDIRQSILGSLLNYGMLVITGTGGSHQFINYIQKPLTCRRYMEQQMNEH